MQLEVGKYYKTRDGRKVGPATKSRSGDPGVFFIDGHGLCKPDGRFGYGDRDWHKDLDLIAEWTDEPAPVTLSAIDHLRKACELFLADGNDKAAFDVLGVVLDHE